MSYSVNWEESLKDYVKHHDYLIPGIARILRWPITIMLIIEAVLLIVKGMLYLGMACMVFAFAFSLVYYFPMFISVKCFKERARRYGTDTISYIATIDKNNIVINNVTEGISTTKNYYYLKNIIKKDEETLIGVGGDYVCFDLRNYSEKAVTEMVDFMLDRKAELAQ